MEGAQASVGREAAASVIRWWRDAGVDTLIDEQPRDWLARPAPGPMAERTPDRGASAHEPHGASLRASRPEAELPATLPAFLDWLRDSPDAPEARWGPTRLLPAGNPAGGLMILIDMPEPGDAAAGMLIAGEVGALFDRMLAAIKHDRQSVWLASMATVRPVGGLRTAAARLGEIARHHVGLVAPKRLLIMGDAANRALIGPDWQQRRGSLQSINLGAVTVEAVATFHPRLLHERPAFKAQAWKDLQLLMKGA